MTASRHEDWLRQALNDLEWAEHSLRGGFFAQTCFIAQQAGEKALKALSYARGYDTVKTHSLFRICQALGEDGELQEHARELDLYYVSGRYPDAFPAGAPFEILPGAEPSAPSPRRGSWWAQSGTGWGRPPMGDAVLGRSRPPVTVADQGLERICAFLRERLAVRGVRAAYLFGSAARGADHAWSDIDLVIVTDTDEPFVERPRAFWDLLDLGIPVDLLVYTPEEFEGMEAHPTAFWNGFRQSRLRLL